LMHVRIASFLEDVLSRFSSLTFTSVAVFLLLGLASAQTSKPITNNPIDASTSQPKNTVAQPMADTRQDASPSRGSISTGPAPRLVIGSGDELDIGVFGIPDLAQKVRVNSDGDIALALIGKVHVANMTCEEAADVIAKRYVDGGFLRNPNVTVYAKEYTTQGIAISGEVKNPGVYSPFSSRSLSDLILLAGGLTERAGKTVTITHAKSGEAPTMVTLSSDPIKNAEANVSLQAGDSVIVSRGGVVYVLGEVNRPGGFVMENNESMSVLQAIALAQGPTHVASLSHVKMIRRSQQGLKEEEIPLKKILEAKAPDVPLQADDILFISGSAGKSAVHTSSSLVGVLANALIYRF